MVKKPLAEHHVDEGCYFKVCISGIYLIFYFKLFFENSYRNDGSYVKRLLKTKFFKLEFLPKNFLNGNAYWGCMKDPLPLSFDPWCLEILGNVYQNCVMLHKN